MKLKFTYLILLGLISKTAFAVQLLDPPAMTKPTNVTVFIAKKIVTMDPALPTATAVAVANGRILSVGSLEDLKPWTDNYPHQINQQFKDKVIYPGFIEAHGHPLLAGILYTQALLTPQALSKPWGPAFPGVPTLQAALAQLKKYSASLNDPQQPLLAWGYDAIVMGVTPDRNLLDKVSMKRPIIVWDISGHNMFVNSATITHYGITPENAKKILGVGIDKNGQLNGQFMDIAAISYLLRFIAKDVIIPNEIPNAYRYINDLMQQGGITTSGDMAFGTLNIAAEIKAIEAFTTNADAALRIVPVAYATPFIEKYGSNAIQEVEKLSQLNNDRLFFQGVKFYSDQGYLPETMRMEHPSYTDGSQGFSNYTSAAEFAQAMQPWWNAGFHIHIHSNGDVGNQNTLNALQLLQDSKPRFDHRFTVEHFGIPSLAMVIKVKALGAVVSANLSYIFERATLENKALGVDRAAYATRLGTLTHTGVITSIHSDTPVSAPVPLTEVWAAVTRRNLYSGDKEWAKAEAVSVYEAMKMITINAAYTLGVEDKVGTIEAGKYADFVVLDDDPQSVAATKIKDVPIIATVSGGKVILVSDTKQKPLR